VFTDVIGKLYALTDRSTGTAGNQEAALFIKEKLEQLGYSDLGTYRFSVPVMRNEKSRLILAERNVQIDLHPIRGNAVTPQTVGSEGLSGPLIYVGRGELRHLNAKQIAGSIILMEMDSGKNWLHTANLGARALIFIDRGESPNLFLKEKFELSPLQFPRFWMSRTQAKESFGDFENAPGGQIAAKAQLTSRIRWQLASSENIYCFVTGSDPSLREKLILVEAFYDSTPTVAGLSPGADEAVGIATLLELARFLKAHPPQRSVLLVASSGHAQTLAGMREMIWSISARSKDLRKFKKSYGALAKKTRKTIKLLKKMPVESAAQNESTDIATTRLIKAAIDERLKIESDQVSRHLMRLRLGQKDRADRELIDKLANQRLLQKRLLWSTDYSDLSAEDRQALAQLIPKVIQDQKAILADASRYSREISDARSFRRQVREYLCIYQAMETVSAPSIMDGCFRSGRGLNALPSTAPWMRSCVRGPPESKTIWDTPACIRILCDPVASNPGKAIFSTNPLLAGSLPLWPAFTA
jgi:hypothetical protein